MVGEHAFVRSGVRRVGTRHLHLKAGALGVGSEEVTQECQGEAPSHRASRLWLVARS